MTEPSQASAIFPLYHLPVHINMDKGISSLHRQAYPPKCIGTHKKKRLHLELEYQRSWHLAILISSAHVYPFSFQHFLLRFGMSTLFYYYQPASQWVYGEKRLFIPPNPQPVSNRSINCLIQHPKNLKHSTPGAPIKDLSWLFHLQYLDKLGRRHIPVDWRRGASRHPLALLRSKGVSLQLGRQLAEVIHVWDV